MLKRNRKDKAVLLRVIMSLPRTSLTEDPRNYDPNRHSGIGEEK